MHSPKSALAEIWAQTGLPAHSLERAQLTGQEPVFPSSFAVGTAAQVSIAAAALAATELGASRGQASQTVAVDMSHAALECVTHFAVNGVVPQLWDKYSGIYRCANGFVRIHANFDHHREGALAVLGLEPGEATSKADVEKALASWNAQDYEQTCAERGLVVAALRTHEAWQAHPQAVAVQSEPLFAIKSIAACASLTAQKADFFYKKEVADGALPLAGLRVLDLTRILAGPVAGRALAAYGADVLMVNSPHLPNIEAIADTSRGKRSCHIDLKTDLGREQLRELVRGAHVFIQGYRPGGLAELGFSPEELAALNPAIVSVELRAYGFTCPWANRRGFDSLVQTATGFNHDESQAAGIDLTTQAPQALPTQMLDHATGYLMAFAAQAALIAQARDGGAWHVQLSFARTGEWLRGLGRVENGFSVSKPSP